MTLRTRRPTGMVPPPLVLLEGETGSGRSWTAAELSASPRIGRTLWIELGEETTADQYGAIPGARYEIVTPDNDSGVWDWHALYAAVKDAKEDAGRAEVAGEQPTVLTIDQGGAIWDMLCEWADNRARSTKANRAALADNPNYEYTIGSNFWNDATARWNKLMTQLLTFPGIVVLLSRGQEITLFENGQPTKRKTWKVAGQKDFTNAVPIWVRLTRDGNPKLIKLRTVHNGIRPGADREQAVPGLSLEWLIFERYGWDPPASGTRSMVPMVAGDEAPESPRCASFLVGVETAEDLTALERIWPHVVKAVNDGEITEAEGTRVKEAIRAAKEQMDTTTGTDIPPKAASAAGPNDYQHRRMHAQWRELGIGGDEHRDNRLAQTSMIVGRDIDTSAHLTPAEADKVIASLDQQISQQKAETPAGAAA